MKLCDILLLADDPFSSALKSTVEIVDSLHAFPSVPKLPVVVTRKRREQGSYHYLVRPGRPIRIEVSRFAQSPAWTLVHETGHLLDHLILNPIKRGFGSDHDPLFDDLSALWRQSKLVTSLNQLFLSRADFVDTTVRKIFRDYLMPRELWARSYVQWVAMRSQDQALLSHLERLQNEGDSFAGVRFPTQWDETDFDVIMGGIDELIANARLNMTIRAKSHGSIKRSAKRGAPRANERGKSTMLSRSDLYENGKRVTGLPSIFERVSPADRRAISQLKAINMKRITPTQAWAMLKMLQALLEEN